MTSEHHKWLRPYGGAEDTARSMIAAHQPEHRSDFWSRPQVCRGCGDPWPCRSHREATQVIPVPLGARTRHEPTWVDWVLGAGVVAGVVVGLAVVAVGWMLIGAWS